MSNLSFWPDGPPERPSVLTVGQIVRGANRLLEGKFTNVWVEGEVSGLRTAGSGHVFFLLTDDEAVLPATIWRSTVERLRFALADGQMLRVYGRLGVFAKQGRMQFYVDRAEPAGLGALQLELEDRKRRLAAEGLLDPARKRALPRWPRVVGVVTSASGAAIHDIIEVARRRCPVRIVLAPAVVQGPEAPRSLTRALVRLARIPGVDVIILGRGGGSADDLAAFQDEGLARAVAACPVPVVSAVGHEVDVTICDLVADLRAATPSHAAELVVPDRATARARIGELESSLVHMLRRRLLDERAHLHRLETRLARAARRRIDPCRIRLSRIERRLAAVHPRARVVDRRRRLAALWDRLLQAGNEITRPPSLRRQRLLARLRSVGPALARARRLRWARAAGALHALSPLAVLARGYAVVTDARGRALVDPADVESGDRLDIRVQHGTLVAIVVDAED